MSLKAAKATAWKWCSLYIRLRDSIDGGRVKCCTCNTWKSFREMEAGHYFPKGSGSGRYIEFDVDNIHPQETSCNHYKSGNLAVYTEYMTERYGHDIFARLQQRNDLNRFKIIKESGYRELANEFRLLAHTEAKRVGVKL